ncbi:MAG: hypothetical protein ACKVW3_08165 [Phycisphaerales bacterium]
MIAALNATSAPHDAPRHATPHVRWPCDRFYWAIIPTQGWRGKGDGSSEVPVGLRATLDDDFPVRTEELHAVAMPMASDTILVCAARRDELATLAKMDHPVLSLTPESLPHFVASHPGISPSACSPATLNLLIGEFEPAPVRCTRRHAHTIAAATVLLCAVLTSLGLLRRAERSDALAREARQATIALVGRVVPAGTPASMATELASLRAARPAARTAPDATLALAAVLAAWPRDATCRTQSITVGPSGASIAVTIPGDAAPFLRAFKAPAGWTMDEPRLNAADKATRLAIRIRPPEALP